MQVRLKAAAIEVPPCSLFIVIMKAGALLARGTRPALRLVVLGPHVNSLLLQVEFDAVYGPGLLEAQQLPVQIGVTHEPSVALYQPTSRTSGPPRRATRFPDVPLKYA